MDLLVYRAVALAIYVKALLSVDQKLLPDPRVQPCMSPWPCRVPRPRARCMPRRASGRSIENRASAQRQRPPLRTTSSLFLFSPIIRSSLPLASLAAEELEEVGHEQRRLRQVRGVPATSERRESG